MTNSRMIYWAMFLFATSLFPASETIGQQGNPAQRMDVLIQEARRTGSSSTWTPNRWEQSSGYAPDEEIGEVPDDEVLDSITVAWESPVVESLGNSCVVKGQLLMKEQEEAVPINWRQGVSVFIAKQPGVTLDWSRGMKQADTGSQAVLADIGGKFEMSLIFSDHKIAYGRDGGEFQFGLALATRKTDDEGYRKIIWACDQAALPSSITMLTIPPAPSISRELFLINEARGWPFSDPDSVKLIRAVNSLQPLGKEKALAVLEEYLSRSQEADSYGDDDIVFWIVRVLFEPIHLDETIPVPMIGVALYDRDLPEELKWPLNPMAVVDDIPFMIGCQIGVIGHPEYPGSHIEFARSYCVIRDEPLKPKSNPLAVADSILNSKKFAALPKAWNSDAIGFIRNQGVAMVSDLVGPLPERNDGPGQPSPDADWKSKVSKAQSLGIEWSESEQAFVAKEDR